MVTTVATYYHDLYGVARADQLVYFYRTVKINDFWSLTFGAFDFNRTHSVGDYVLFRPVLYFFLGVEKWLWGYNMLAWQATSVGLHVAVVVSLFAYFRECLADAGAVPENSWHPFAASAFFATLYAGSEMVAWQHLAGYLLFCLLLVQSAIRYRAFASRPSGGRAAALVAVATIAAFTYELGVVALAGFGLLCALMATKSATTRRVCAAAASALLLAIVAYVTTSHLDLIWTGQRADVPQVTAAFAEAATDVAGYAFRWTAGMLLPAAVNLHIGSRITVETNLYPVDPGSVALVAILVTGGLLAQHNRNRKRLVNMETAALFLALAIAYVVSTVIYRAIPRGFEATFTNNSYYVYIFALLCTMAFFHLVAVPSATDSARAMKYVYLLVVPLLLIATVGAYKTYGLMRNERRYYAAPIRQMIERINELVRQHEDENDFSFTVTPGCKENPDLPWFSIQTTVRRSSYPTAWVLYPQYERDSGGKYIVPCGNP